jgi:hypothetical protein
MLEIGGRLERTFVQAVALLALTGAPAWAQAPVPSPSPAAAPAEAAPAPAIDVLGYADLYYGYNFNKVAPALRSFDVQHNAFSLSQAEIDFSKAATTDSPVGFRVDLAFGKTADLVAFFEPEDGGPEIYKNIQQAYVSALLGEKLTLDVGKFNTPIGAEVIESQDNWNYSRSVLFGYAIPFYHTGVRATLAASDKLSLVGHVSNGWNNSSAIRDGRPGIGAGATLKPSGTVTWVGNVMFGPESPDPDPDTRVLFDTTLTVALNSKLSVMGNFDYGKEGDVTWWGLAAYAKLQASDNWALAGRFEYLDDSDGGFMTISQKAQTYTITSDHKVKGDLKLRLEYRLDRSDDFFVKDDGDVTSSQSAVVIGLVYAFSGKI